MSAPVTIITGAGSGIGRATAIALASKGYRLALCARRRQKLNETANLAGNGLVIAADVTQPKDIESIVETTFAEFGRIDAIVNNAGFAPVQSIEEMSIVDWHAVIDTNLSAAFYLSKAVWPIFKRQGGGAVVNISSMAARDPFPGFAAYGAAKAGLNLFSLSVAREGANIGVRVYTIAPGAVETEMFRGIMNAEQFPTERTLQPADVARIVVQCIAGDLQFTSGEVIWMRKSI
jgi:NAD(P)-dependent dehydrogenase (short-subunit alcohol dehydrogenase family)